MLREYSGSLRVCAQGLLRECSGSAQGRSGSLRACSGSAPDSSGRTQGALRAAPGLTQAMLLEPISTRTGSLTVNNITHTGGRLNFEINE